VNHQVLPSPDQQQLRTSDAMVAGGDTIGVIAVGPSGCLVHYTPAAASWLSDREHLRLGDTWYEALPEPVRLRMHREWIMNVSEVVAHHQKSASSLTFCFENDDASRQVVIEFAVPVSDSSQRDLFIGTVRVSYLKPLTWVSGNGSDVGGETGGGCELGGTQTHPSIVATRVGVSLSIQNEPSSQNPAESPLSLGSCIFSKRKSSSDANKETGALDVHCTLLASMNHEMQQPIYAMQNFMFAARQYLKMGQLDQVELMLTKIERQIVRSREMSDRLRHIAIRSKHVPHYSDVHQLIESCRDLVQIHADDARTLLLIDLQATTTSVMGDGGQIQQVILNLIRNSADSLASTDSPDRSLVIATANDSHKIWIRVIDSGPGIQSVDEQRIFDQFFTTKETGLGIGLTFCRSVIAAHGGELTLHENRPGRVVFQIELPLSE